MSNLVVMPGTIGELVRIIKGFYDSILEKKQNIIPKVVVISMIYKDLDLETTHPYRYIIKIWGDKLEDNIAYYITSMSALLSREAMTWFRSYEEDEH